MKKTNYKVLCAALLAGATLLPFTAGATEPAAAPANHSARSSEYAVLPQVGDLGEELESALTLRWRVTTSTSCAGCHGS